MKYLKSYNKLFESVSEIEEAFYNVSDSTDVYVETILKEDESSAINFTKPIMYFKIGDNKKFPKHMGIINNTNQSIMPKNSIKVTINSDFNPIGLNKIKEDLEFAINYLTKELNFTLVQIYIHRVSTVDEVGHAYPKFLMFKDLNTLLEENNILNSTQRMVFFFKPSEQFKKENI